MDIEERRTAFYGRADGAHLAPLWTRLRSLVPAEPTPVGVPHRWSYADVRPYVLESAEHISAKEAERRVLILENPVHLDPERHMNNRRLNANPLSVTDDEASALLDDIIRDNPDKQAELALMINRINSIRRASRPTKIEP